MAIEKQTPTNAYRPKQVLLIGLGGVGGRIVDNIMERVPEKYRPYTQAVSIDTDKNEISVLKNIPIQNQIAIGEDMTIGSFMRDNEDSAEWMVKGDQLDLIRSRNTANGAKQIRLVSRIALRATNQQGNLGKRIENAINTLNAVDGKIQGNGLLVLVVCSIAGGTGAGTVIQVPMYLEDAIKTAYSSEKVQFECAMLMPNAFSQTLSDENFYSAKVNGYAVLKELMSLNTGRLRRFEYLDASEVDKNDERIAPYGRVMLFDDRNGEGEAISGAVDTTHAPLMVDSLVEYLFGPANGKITSALDNTLKRVYDTNGAGIFGAVGKANLVFPRVLYKQYAASKWISKSMSKTWGVLDEITKEEYRKAVKDAKANGEGELPEDVKYGIYLTNLLEGDLPNQDFFEQIRGQLTKDGNASLAKLYWEAIVKHMERSLFTSNRELTKGANNLTVAKSFKAKDEASVVNEMNSASLLYEKVAKLESGLANMADDIMRPMDAKDEGFYEDEKQSDLRMNVLMREENLHPIALRCFLYQLYSILAAESSSTCDIADISKKSQAEWVALLKDKKDRNSGIQDEVNRMISSAKKRYRSVLAGELLRSVKELILEVEDFFGSINKVQAYFEDTAENCLEEIDVRGTRADMTIIGSRISMVNCWKNLEQKVHIGEEDDGNIIDKSLCSSLNRQIYFGYYKHVSRSNQTVIKIDNKPFRLPTDYAKILRVSLATHFINQLSSTYAHEFPEDIVEAVKYDCGVKNYWNIVKQTVPHMTLEEFICPNPLDEDHAETAKRMGLSVFDPVKELNDKLSFAIGKAEPRCGLVNMPEANYTARYIVMNEDILQQRADFDASEESSDIKLVSEKAYIIPGVSTSMINGVNVNACFNGNSKDIITCITSYSGLEPSDFVALLAPTYDKNAPQEAMGYYKAYRDYINEVVSDPTKITPHLDRRWHIADVLADITKEHTSSVWKHAAKAFVYGFAYDLISVKNDGSVTFGQAGNPIFGDLAPRGELIVKDFMSAEERAVLSNITGKAKTDKLNAILNGIFVRLTSDPIIVEAIIKYAEEELKNDRIYANSNFFDNVMKEESVADSRYEDIIDVIDGYYKGAMKAEHIEEGYALETTQYMLEVLVSTFFEFASAVSTSPADIKLFCEAVIDALYDKAVCDDPIETPAKKTGAMTIADIKNILAVNSDDESEMRPFAGDKNYFSRSVAKNIIEQLLKESV